LTNGKVFGSSVSEPADANRQLEIRTLALASDETTTERNTGQEQGTLAENLRKDVLFAED